jgi:hypothetical protein
MLDFEHYNQSRTVDSLEGERNIVQILDLVCFLGFQYFEDLVGLLFGRFSHRGKFLK